MCINDMINIYFDYKYTTPDYSALPGSGFIRLHSTYRHDLKIYASDEGRVQTTAAAFAKVRIILAVLTCLIRTGELAGEDIMCHTHISKFVKFAM